MYSSSLGIFLIAASILFGHSAGHTWNEQFSLINENGEYTGAYGYPRGYVPRGAYVDIDTQMTNLIPNPDVTTRTRIDNTDLLCHESQREPNQPSGFPRLQVGPGSWVAMKYLENGHVTMPWVNVGKPPMTGTVFVYGTTSPKPDEKLAEVLLWNRAGNGGDSRGRLLTAQNFDDGRCHQQNYYESQIAVDRMQKHPDFSPDSSTTNELWCETDVQMPKDLTPGKPLTIYWVWEWPTAVNTLGVPEGKDQYYTTCSDFDVVAKQPDGPITSTLLQQDPNTLAVQDWKSRAAITQTPRIEFDPISGNRLYVNSTNFMYPTTTITTSTPPAPTAWTTPINTALSTMSSAYSTPMTPAYSTPMAPVSTPIAPAPVPTVPSVPPPVEPVAPSSAPTTPLTWVAATTTTPYVPMPPAPTTTSIYAPPVAPTPGVDSANSYQYSSIPLSSAPPPPPPPPPPTDGGQTSVVMTALITITATLAPTQSMLVVAGTHTVTFTNTPAAARRTAGPEIHRAHARLRRRRRMAA